MLQFWVELGCECFQGGGCAAAVEEAPNRGAAIAVSGSGTNGIAGLEGKVRLDGVDWGEVVVLDFAELDEAVEREEDVLGSCGLVQ